MVGLQEDELRKVAKERAVRLNTYDPTTGIFKEDKQQLRCVQCTVQYVYNDINLCVYLDSLNNFCVIFKACQ